MSVIAIDCDGTIMTHEYPKIGKDIGAIPVLKRLIKNGHKLILWTMRSDNKLAEAVEWLEQNNVTLTYINRNPTQLEWTNSPKIYAELYIDDAAAFCPLKSDRILSRRPFVDWVVMEQWLEDHGYFNHENEITTIEL